MATEFLQDVLCSGTADSSILDTRLHHDLLKKNGLEVEVTNRVNLEVIDHSKIESCFLELPILEDKFSTIYICRLCATEIDNISALNIFNTGSFQENFATKINKYLPIMVCESDPFPKAICKTCVNKINDFHELFQKSLLVEEHFRRMYIFDNRYCDIQPKSNLELLKEEPGSEFSVSDIMYTPGLIIDGLSVKTEDHNTLLSDKLSTSFDDNKQDELCCRFCNSVLSNVQTCLEHCSLHGEDTGEQLICVLCQYLMTSSSERDIHVQAHYMEMVASCKRKLPAQKCRTMQKTLMCNKCNDTLDCVSTAVKHCMKHKPVGSKTVPCILCKKLLLKAKLVPHMTLHFPALTKTSLTCDICNNVYTDEKSLKYHRCSKLRKYKCSLCNLGFKSEDRLQFHENVHKTKSTHCEICKKDFKFESKLYLHFSSVHNGIRDKPFCCDVCGKTFVWLTDLNSHIRTHTNERPYKCTKCEASFYSKYVLLSHTSSHDNPKFVCEKCDYHSCRKVDMQKHVSRYHKEIEPSQLCVQCQQCDEVFPNRHHVMLEQHDARHAGSTDYVDLVVTKLFQCERCERCFPSLQHLAQHRPVHPSTISFQCRLCDAEFPKHDRLVRHQKVHISMTSQYDSKLQVLQVISCDVCSMECVDYRQLLNHKDRGSCDTKKNNNGRKTLVQKHLKPLKAHQLYVNATGLYECRVCQRTYKNRRRYRLHLATHS